MKGRFAPSPTGRMHLGNIYSALLAWLSTRSQEGTFILRIEDIDRQRSKAEYAAMIEDDLRWLGLDWDEKYVQSERFDLYEDKLCSLEASGHTYSCYCTRAEIMATQAPHESDGRIVHTECQRLSDIRLFRSGTNRPVRSVRLIVPDKEVTFTDQHYGIQSVNLARQCGDFVLKRGDGAWAYQLAVVIDDAMTGVTEVVRGRDLLLSVPQQEYLHRLLGFTPPAYCHLPLLCNGNGQRLSKRDKSLDMECLRQRLSPEEVIGQLAFHAGLSDSPVAVTARELIPLFSWDKVPLGDITVSDSVTIS
ncbi:MAG: tRNA glutamyl-Q(34) synthetase GluQRS [Bacteroidales bacterium]|nr:tRNA glutamyl-Q(34) synthetase GluQRS [Bacteroidales bacterium]MCM1148342.1 tRNA glutamyl-Q(34) synthetase GluQRS [Bacteroidales bacterium]MCM1206965.1 tRNA glutamyl-Q(34) synthetase GluQRS [Bacillota bacterium]MCM1511261.1 tRNA glutamyl-Q(34) synthetase GluQRS [Clostridium sp.]